MSDVKSAHVSRSRHDYSIAVRDYDPGKAKTYFPRFTSNCLEPHNVAFVNIYVNSCFPIGYLPIHFDLSRAVNIRGRNSTSRNACCMSPKWKKYLLERNKNNHINKKTNSNNLHSIIIIGCTRSY